MRKKGFVSLVVRACVTMLCVLCLLSACGSTQDYIARVGYGASDGAGRSDGAAEASAAAESTSQDGVEEGDGADAPEVVVHISGAVAQPGVYHMAEGSRLMEAVEAAGGFTQEAAADAMNLAQVVCDGQQYRILTAQEAEAQDARMGGGADVPSSVYTGDGRLDINQAGLEELMRLPGIGETRAQAILAYREEHGGFATPEELKQVSGIGDATYEKLSAQIAVR